MGWRVRSRQTRHSGTAGKLECDSTKGGRGEKLGRGRTYVKMLKRKKSMYTMNQNSETPHPLHSSKWMAIASGRVLSRITVLMRMITDSA